MFPALWSLSRPRMLPFVLLLPLLGYGWAHWDHALDLVGPGRMGLVLMAWALLHAGTLWLNAVLDRDEEPVLFGSPVAVPQGTATAGYLSLAATVGVAAAAAPLAGLAAAGCAALAVLYSHPRSRWKAHPLGGPAINAVGYGLLSPLAGWAVVGAPLDLRSLLVWPLLAVGLLAPTFAAQAFQGEADRRRGYRTLVVLRGPEACLRAARAALLLAVAWGLGLAAIGLVPRLCLAGALPWMAVVHAMRPSTGTQGGPARAQRLVLAMTAATAFEVVLAAVDMVIHTQ